MTKASDNAYPSILITEGTEPSAPAAGKQRLYIDSTTHKLKRTDSSGTDVTIEGLTNPMTTAGDIIYSSDGSGTPARLASAGTTGKFLKGANAAAPSWVYPPGYEYDYTEKTSATSITNTTEGAADTVVTATGVAYDGSTVIIVEFFSPAWRPDTGAANRTITLVLYDDNGGGAASIGIWAISNVVAGAADNKPILVRRRLTPTNATHTYSVRAYVSAGTGSVGGGAGGSGANMPAYIRQIKAT